ncbi:hypothetical protein [Taklimakanibacter lacteus]|uniref:hypothetical protein n=1 Tax=Taklimakanibacter lacteus TaxID=2268456 RepID=UPI000E66D11D
MTPSRLGLLADLILPGDAAGLPRGSLIPEVMLALAGSASPIKGLLGERFDFAEKDLRLIEQSHPAEFRELVMSLIKPYYESGKVLEAMGWRSAPPQPLGHRIAAMDEALAAELARIAERKRIWR